MCGDKISAVFKKNLLLLLEPKPGNTRQIPLPMVKKNIKMLSPENYIRQKGRSLPIHECLINTDWKQANTANILICRLQPSGKYTVGIYLVDLLCLGVKDTNYFFNLPEDEYQKVVNAT